jgi:hypothetical protein
MQSADLGFSDKEKDKLFVFFFVANPLKRK